MVVVFSIDPQTLITFLCFLLGMLPPCSLGLVLPPYSEYYIQADLSDVMLQLQCEYHCPPRKPLSPFNSGPGLYVRLDDTDPDEMGG
jgi:hypothetical protein